jgi:ElaB/YqjD/DUF883 family membrane-anchored ribosome-binding protein
VEVITIEEDKEEVKVTEPESSLSDILNNRMEEMKEELNELSVVLDDLMKSISIQTATLVEQSRESARSFKERARRRHERAKFRAKLVRNVGERVLLSAGREVKERVEKARQRAHTLRQCPSVVNGNQLHGCWGQTRLTYFGL